MALFRFVLSTAFLVSTFCSFSQRAGLINIDSGSISTRRGDSIKFETAWFEVPENRKATSTDKLSLKILIIKAVCATPGTPVVFLAGGPGQSGINYIKQNYFQDIILSLHQHHDVILLDQRGCGTSLPSLIYKVPRTDNKNIFLTSETIINVANIQAKAGADTMRARHIDIRGYNTEQNAEDLAELSNVLGVKKLDLLAISYGTHLALAAARQHPDLIDHMVLIGTSGPDNMHHLPSTYDTQLQKISALAAQDPGIRSKVPDMSRLLKKILIKLDKQPIVVRVQENRTGDSIDVPIGKFGLQFILRLDAGDASDFILFPAMLYGIEKGDYSIFQEYVEKRYNQLNGEYASAIGVMRTASGASSARFERIKKEGKTALLGNAMNTPDIYSNNYWGDIDLGDDYRDVFSSNVSTLFISGSMDSNTPVANVNEIKSGFSNASHLIVEYAGHEDMLSNRKVQRVFSDFFSGTKPAVDTLHLDKPVFEPIP